MIWVMFDDFVGLALKELKNIVNTAEIVELNK